MERVAGIEPASSAWKAEVLPLNYTRAFFRKRPHARFRQRPTAQSLPAKSLLPSEIGWWWGKDSNLRRLSRQIYSLIPLTTREPHQLFMSLLYSIARFDNFFEHKSTIELAFLVSSMVPCAHRSEDRPFQPGQGVAIAFEGASQRRFHAMLRKLTCTGAATRSRTLDLLITSELLYQLSYGGRNGSGIL